MDNGNHKAIGTHEKALRINLDPAKYGTFAEIGAGQEVARWFFQVGGAAGTVAKSMSAYDMTFSDAIYGPSPRYVSRQRLETMLQHEFDILRERLNDKRGENTTFFVFADTVAARSFKGDNECHGWLGVRFQREPRGPASDIILHVRMLDQDNLQQQEALSVVGVNLVYGALYLADHPENLIASLLDGLTVRRIEVDMIRFSGAAFANVDNRLMSLQLVELGLSDAAMFAADGEVLQPSEILRKRAIFVERGTFRPVTHIHIDMLENAEAEFIKEPDVQGKEVLTLMEITKKNLRETAGSDHADFLARADTLAACGKTVLISNFAEYYRLAAYFTRYTKEPVGLALGISSLRELFDERYYDDLEGGILESFGRLFRNKLKLYIYPMKDPATGKLQTIHSFKVAPHLQNLYSHLVENGCIESIDSFNPAYMHMYSRDCIVKIQAGDATWKQMVPPTVAGVIKSRKLFGYVDRPEARE